MRNALIQERLDLLGRRAVLGRRKVKLILHGRKTLPQQGPPPHQGLLQQRRPIQIQQIKRKYLDRHTHIVRLHVFALPPAQLLKRQQPPRLRGARLPRHSLSIQHKTVHTALPEAMGYLHDKIRVLDAHVLRIAAKHTHLKLAVLHKAVHLRTLAIVLVLTRKGLRLKPVQHLANRLGRLRQHGLERNARRQGNVLVKVLHAMRQQGWDQHIVRRQLTEHGLDGVDTILQRWTQVGHVAGLAPHHQHHCLRHGHEHRLFGEANPQLALQTADQVLGLIITACR